MLRHWIATVLIIVLLVSGMTSHAQTDEPLYEIYENGTLTFRYPQGWRIYEPPNVNRDFDRFGLSIEAPPEDQLSIFISGELPRSLMRAGPLRALNLAMEENWLSLSDDAEITGEAAEISLETYPAARIDIRFERDDVSGAVIALEVDDATYLLIWAITRGENLNRFEPELIAIAESIRYDSPYITSPLQTLEHGDYVLGARWSSDGGMIASWPGTRAPDGEATVQIWDANTGEALLALAQPFGVRNVAWNRDDTRLLTTTFNCHADCDGHQDQVVVWDAQSGDQLFAMNHEDRIAGAMWNADETRILSWSNDGMARVWDAESGDNLLTLSGAPGAFIADAAWNPDESRIAVVSGPSTVVFDAETGEKLAEFADKNVLPNGAAWHPEGTHLATWGFGETLSVWELASGEAVASLPHQGFIGIAAWSSDGRQMMSLEMETGIAHLWDVASGGEVFRMGSTYAPIMNDDTSRIYSTVEAGGLLWNADTGAQIAALPSAEDGIWSSDGQRLLTRSAKLIQIWDADVGQKLSGIFLEKFGYNFDGWVMWNADESRILTTHPQEGQIMIWEAPIR